jgi:hypothetical protein
MTLLPSLFLFRAFALFRRPAAPPNFFFTFSRLDGISGILDISYCVEYTSWQKEKKQCSTVVLIHPHRCVNRPD